MAQLASSTPRRTLDSWAITRDDLWRLGETLKAIMEREGSEAVDLSYSVSGIDPLIKSKDDWDDTISQPYWDRKAEFVFMHLRGSDSAVSVTVQISFDYHGSVQVSVHGGTSAYRDTLMRLVTDQMELYERPVVNARGYYIPVVLACWVAVSLLSYCASEAVQRAMNPGASQWLPVAAQFAVLGIVGLIAWRFVKRGADYLKSNIMVVENLPASGVSRKAAVDATYQRVGKVAVGAVTLVATIAGVIVTVLKP